MLTHFLLFFTNWSNLLSAAAACGSLICLYRGVRPPRVLAVLKLAAVVMLTITFLVVALVLCPSSGWWVMFDPNGLLFLHFLVPILTVFEFLFLADMQAPGRSDVPLALLPMLAYIVWILAILIVAGNDDLAPYPFLRIHEQPLLTTAVGLTGMVMLAYGTCYGYARLVRRTNPSMSDPR